MAVTIDPQLPFVAFNFSVEIRLPDPKKVICSAAFSECDGLEVTMEVKTIREGGNNGRQIRLSGPLSYGQLVLKRGMTKDTGLWNWFAKSFNNPSLRATTEVVMFTADVGGKVPTRHFSLEGCLPIKFKAPALNAKDGLIAIEEMQIAYESLTLISVAPPPPPPT
jgi:phage tail-like protein